LRELTRLVRGRTDRGRRRGSWPHLANSFRPIRRDRGRFVPGSCLALLWPPCRRAPSRSADDAPVITQTSFSTITWGLRKGGFRNDVLQVRRGLTRGGPKIT